MLTRCFLVFCLIFAKISADEGVITAKRATSSDLKHFCVYGERCSGTNFVEQLIKQNSELSPILWCHKHFPPWYCLGIEAWKGSARTYLHANTDPYLFVIVVRDPYDWIRSMNIHESDPYSKLSHLSLSEFMRAEWSPNFRSSPLNVVARVNPLVERDPVTKKLFKNIMALRSAKIKAYKAILDLAPNVILVRYESVRDQPEAFLQVLHEQYGVTLNDAFTSIDTVKGGLGWQPYEPTVYEPISDEDLAFINSELDWDEENSLGYNLKDSGTF